MTSTLHRVWAAALIALCAGAGHRAQSAAPVTTWAAPRGETLYEDYALRVDGQPEPVYS